jgi:flagellin
MALNTHRRLGITADSQAKSMEKLSSGLRINRAGDDAAGLAISEKMRAQIRGLKMASKNAQDGISMLQTAEGALNETHEILQRMREITVQAINDTNTNAEDRSALDKEYKALANEITRIGNDTEFNKTKLLNGSLNSSVSNIGTNLTTGNGITKIVTNGAKVATGYKIDVDTTAGTISLTQGTHTETINYGGAPTGFNTKSVNFTSMGISLEINASIANISANNTFDISATGSVALQIGANSGQTMNISVGDMRATALGGATKLSDTSLASSSDAITSLDSIDIALKEVSEQRAQLGAFQNRLEYTIKNLNTSAENMTSAESRIRDADMASEMMNYTKNSILQQAAQAMLAQANQAPQSVLSLLR